MGDRTQADIVLERLAEVIAEEKDLLDDNPAVVTLTEQLRVFVDALRVMADREKKYGGLWQSYGWRGVVMHIQSKAARIRRVWWDTSGREDPYGNMADLDDAIDLINYCGFFIRNVNDDNETGAGYD